MVWLQEWLQKKHVLKQKIGLCPWNMITIIGATINHILFFLGGEEFVWPFNEHENN